MGGIKREREGYISKSGPANRHQRILAKEAIIRMLKIRRYSSPEIAEHFGLAEDIVEQLVSELVKAGHVVRENGSGSLAVVKNTWKSY
ncbi:MAG: hypothetical protein ACOY46_01020 [Bacillota bacterium]